MKKKLFTVIIALVLVAATPLAFASMLSGCKNPDPAEEYVALESNAMHKLINDTFANASPSSDVHTTTTVDVILADTFYELMSRQDLAWIDRFTLAFDVHQDSYLTEMLLTTGVNGNPLLSYNCIANPLSGVSYIAIPTISDYYVKSGSSIPTDDITLEDVLAQLNTPETEVAKALLIKYVDIAITNMVNIEKSTQELIVKGVSQEVNVYTNYITEKVFMDGIKAVLTEAKADSQIKAIFPAEANFEAAIDKAIASLNEQTPSDDKNDAIVLITYADKDNNVVGRKLSTSTFSLSHITLSTISGSVSETFIGEAQNSFRLEGSRTSGSSSYTLFITSAGQSIEVGTIASSGNKKAGTCEITLSDFIEQNLFNTTEANIALKFQWNVTDTRTDFDVYMSLMSQQLFAIKTSTTQGAEKDIVLPSTSLDRNNRTEMQAYIDSIVTDTLQKNMEKIGFTQEDIDTFIGNLTGSIPNIPVAPGGISIPVSPDLS